MVCHMMVGNVMQPLCLHILQFWSWLIINIHKKNSIPSSSFNPVYHNISTKSCPVYEQSNLGSSGHLKNLGTAVYLISRLKPTILAKNIGTNSKTQHEIPPCPHAMLSSCCVYVQSDWFQWLSTLLGGGGDSKNSQWWHHQAYDDWL